MASESSGLPQGKANNVWRSARLQAVQEHIEVHKDEVSEANLEDNARNDDAKEQAKMPTTLRQLAPMDTFICKQLKAADLDRNLTLRIIATAFWMQKTYLESKQKKKKQSQVSFDLEKHL